MWEKENEIAQVLIRPMSSERERERKGILQRDIACRAGESASSLNRERAEAEKQSLAARFAVHLHTYTTVSSGRRIKGTRQRERDNASGPLLSGAK